ncbi:protein misato homolog 1 isoform X1 [Girardinichthys multiradiatus]|uniref:protein misato homolog 1 isoform X1 n=1 Tax=Girardinichthys multiradiatus TaxID=208333 RepID=UPI001FAC6AC6|nr:protein misato homolog 1 isoform X1 [Girardinichthys multiradiatus]
MSGVCREVVTLQLGHYSNFVGTHWWNLQDASLSYDPESPSAEIQSDVLFREGQTLGGHVTYTPRLISMDLKGSLRTLPQEGSLYDPGAGTSAVTWEGSINMHKQSPPEKNSFLEYLEKLDKGEILTKADFCSSSKLQHSGAVSVDTFNSHLARVQNYKLEGSVRVWSDFLRIHLHPRTISVIHQYNHDGEAHRLETFGQGESLLQGALLEELEDKLHFFVEECDYLQGFQVLCDLADGFVGLGSKVTELLQDSYGGRGILTWGMTPVGHRDSTPFRDLCRLLNCSLGMVRMAAHSSLFCPLTLRGGLGRRPTSPPHFPLLTYDPSLWYHSSSVLALALDALTVSYRLRNNSVPMWQVADLLAVSGRKVVAAYGAIPFPMMSGGSLPDALSACADALPWKPLSACPEAGEGQCYGQLTTLKGFEGQKLISCLSPGIKPPTPLHSLHSSEDVLAAYISSFYPSAPLALQLVSSPSKLTPPFPQIFSQSLDAQGFLRSEAPPPGALGPVISSVPVMTSLQSGPALDPWLSELHRATSAFDIRRVAPSFLSQGPEMAEYQEALEELRLLARCYRDDSSGVMRSSSEEEDDD